MKPTWLKTDSPQINQYDVIIGWDSEYRNREWNLKPYQHTVQSNFNDVISYQYAAYAKETQRYHEGIIYTYDQLTNTFLPRLTLEQIIIQVLTNLEITRYSAENKLLHVLLVAHFSVAEYCSLLASERELLDTKLSEVQGTLLSFKPFIVKLKWGNHSVKVLVSWRDTYLHTSDKQRALEDIAKAVDMTKLEISDQHYHNMVSLLTQLPQLYHEYALTDARIALAYYTHVMDRYYHVITKQLVNIEPITTSDATAKYFRAWLQEQSRVKFHREPHYLESKILGTERGWRGRMEKLALRKAEESIASYAYLGGLNTFYRLGHYYCSNDEIALDLDISKAYTSAMATLPAIDWKQRPTTHFNLIEIAKLFNQETVAFSKIGVFITEFNFAPEVYQSSIAQKTEGGLIYTQTGEDFCTWPELTEAVRLGGINNELQILRGSLYQEQTINDQVYLPFAEYLRHLATEQDKWPKGSFESDYFKLMRNGFYGKLAQGIEYRTVYDLNGKRIPLKASPITCAHYASQTTGIIRACVEVLVNYFHQYPGCKVYNATTDGLMITIPKPVNLNLSSDVSLGENGKVKEITKTFRELFPNIVQDIEQFYPIKLLQQGLKNLGVMNGNWLEIKAIGDEIRTEQTRANYIAYRGITQSMARGNVSKKIMANKEDFDSFSDNQEVAKIELTNLVGIREIRELGWDLVEKRVLSKDSKEIWRKMMRNVNIGYDGKRILTENGTNSRLPINLDEWEENRKVVLRMKKKQHRIRVEDFLFRKESITEEGTLRIQGSRTRTIIRVFLSACWKYQLIKKETTNGELMQKLNHILEKEGSREEKITIDDLKNWKRRKFLAKSIPQNEQNLKLIFELENVLKIETKKMTKKVLFS